ncbi:MAG: VWA domain-containing protein [Flavipsychrobacter sp.]|nr:VWA domain-containing protein [Flavipsychrobacter sp.]
MRFIKSLLVLVFIFYCNTQFAQTNDVKQPRILILLDGSSSMNYEWTGGETRFKAASRIILALMDSMYKINKDVEFALRVYGHQYPSQDNNCFDTRLEVMFSKDNIDQMGMRLAALKPIGVSPIALSLKEAAEWDFEKPLRNTYSLILVTDGAESCGGNICDVVKQLLEKKIDFKPYILSLVDNQSLKNGYDCLGTYLPIAAEKDLKPSVGKIVDAYQQVFMLQKIDKKVLMEAVVNAPSVLKVDIPKFKVAKEADPLPVQQEAPKPQVVNTPPPAAKPVIKPAEPVKDLTNRTNESTVPAARELPISTVTGIYNTNPLRSLRSFYAVPEFKLKRVPKVKIPVIKDEPAPKPVVTQAPKPPAPKKETEPVEIKKATALNNTPPVINNKETTLQVYISDGNKYFDVAPIMAVLDPKTKKEVTRFQRTVDVKGQPHPQKIPAGSYLLTIVGREHKHTYDFVAKANENNAIMIPVNNGTIIFFYEGNPKRPMKDYMALVSRRFAAMERVEQKVSEEIPYEPGTYNVRVNTNPPWNVSFDIELGTAHGVAIPEEGDLILSNNSPIGKVTFYYPLGDKFRPFTTINLDGGGKQYTFRILPGKYKAGYKKNPNLPLEEETMVEFTIKSNNVTNLELTK